MTEVTVLKGEHTCNHRWHASRVEIQTADVEHVCVLPKYHKEHSTFDEGGYVHVCSCGAHT